MSFNIVAICNYIANITPASLGMVKVFDLDEVPDEIMARDCPCLWPNVNDGVWSAQEVQRQSFGAGGTLSVDAKKDIAYILRYRMCYAEAGTGRNELKAHIKKIAEATSTIITYMVGTDFPVDTTGVLEFHPFSWSQAGTVVDPSGKMFHGVNFDFYVKEFAELTV